MTNPRGIDGERGDVVLGIGVGRSVEGD